MVLLWSIAICVGLWLLFPKGFKYWVGTLVGTMGGLFFWGLFVVVWFFSQGFNISNELFLGSLVVALATGNGMGIWLAAKG